MSAPFNRAADAQIVAELVENAAALAPLKAIPNWVVWRGDGAPRRACDPSRFASTLDKATWAPYDVARQAVLDGHADGVGFVLTGSRIAAFDLDDCLTWTDEGTFVIARQALELVERCGSYTEITPSGHGLRIIGYGTASLYIASSRLMIGRWKFTGRQRDISV